MKLQKYSDATKHYQLLRPNEKNERLKNLSNYGILGVNEGLFTNDCKKVLNIVQSVLPVA